MKLKFFIIYALLIFTFCIARAEIAPVKNQNTSPTKTERAVQSLSVEGLDISQKLLDIDKELKLLKQARFNPVSASNKSNPDISVNLLLLGKKSFSHEEETDEKSEEHHEEHDHIREGLSVQEVEFYFKSNIDPYWSGTASVGLFAGDHEGQNTEESHTSPLGFQVELEEAFIESLFIPNLTVKMGLFYAMLGRHNNLHTHHYPFIDPPLVNKRLFEGDHGFRQTGLSLAYLSPLPWYSEIIAQAFYEHEESPFSGLLFFKNLWDLNDSSTLEWNVSYGSGIKDYKHLVNSALVFKWQSLNSAKPRSVSWTTELFQASQGLSEDIKGLYSDILWQFLKNWYLQGRVSAWSPTWTKDIEQQKYSVLLSFAPTEYSAFRLQYDLEKSHEDDWSHGISLQSNMSMGAHPAHLY